METSIKTNGLRVFGYVRVSTKKQAEKGLSIQEQREKILAHAALHRLELVAMLEDAGESSKSLDRPAMQNLLGRLKAGEAGGILVAKLDRLSRHVGDMCHLVEEYFESGAFSLLSASETVDPRSANGRAMLYMQTVFSQHQRETSAETTANIMERKKRTKERGGNLRFGYTTDASDARRSKAGNPVALVPCAEDLAVEARILKLDADGLSLRAIADTLNAEGIPSKRGITKRSTGLWSKSTVHEILRRSVKTPAETP